MATGSAFEAELGGLLRLDVGGAAPLHFMGLADRAVFGVKGGMVGKPRG